MANTFEAIGTVTVGAGGASSITFSSILQTYTDLLLKLSTRSSVSGTNDYPRISFNGSSSSQSLRALVGNGTSVSTYTDTLIYTSGAGNTQTANVFGNSEVYIYNYTNTGVNKAANSLGVNENNATAVTVGTFAAQWANTAAITSITIIPFNTGETFLQYSTATLYGIKNS